MRRLSPILFILYVFFVATIASAKQLRPLTDEESKNIHQRVPGCSATITLKPGASTIGVIANAQWVVLGTTEGPVELPVVFRDRGDKNPEVHFSSTSNAGSLRGVLMQLSKGRKCDQGDDCLEVPAQLLVSFNPIRGTQISVFDGEVTVTDLCASNSTSRIFKTTSWWEKFIFWASGSG